MKAIVIQQYGGPEQLVMQDLPDPEPMSGHVVIEVKAFGINHAETHMRKGEWAEAAKVSGIECVGLVAACPGGEFTVGQKVAALMGGMGRTINGSYAEYTRVPTSNVVPIESGLSWEELAAIPESYATAWTCLHRNLDLRAGQTLVIRGATSALGQAALNIAAQAGAQVTATTRNRERISKLEALGAQRVELEGSDLSRRIPKPSDAVLDLIGNSTILDSLGMVGAADVFAWPDSWAVSHPSPRSTHCCRCLAESSGASLAASCLVCQSFLYQMSRSRPSSSGRRPGATRLNRHGFFALMRSARLIE